MIYDTCRNLFRKVCRRIVMAGAHTKKRGLYECQEQYQHFYRCMAFLGRNGIEGDILEYGSADGTSIIMLNSTANEMLKQREKMSYRIFSFDSFEGLPEGTGIDQQHHTDCSTPGVKFIKGGYSFSQEQVQKKLDQEIKNTKHISLIKGWYQNSLTEELKSKHNIRKASFINIDCDFYESTKTALDWCKSLIQQGTIISFDDWYCYKASEKHGEMKAFNDFLKENTQFSSIPYSEYSWHGQSFIINYTEAD
ncbi:MAG: TylF/MycF/NovP-related O-methyltransferase [Methylococcales bacterium]